MLPQRLKANHFKTVLSASWHLSVQRLYTPDTAAPTRNIQCLTVDRAVLSIVPLIDHHSMHVVTPIPKNNTHDVRTPKTIMENYHEKRTTVTLKITPTLKSICQPAKTKQ